MKFLSKSLLDIDSFFSTQKLFIDLFIECSSLSSAYQNSDKLRFVKRARNCEIQSTSIENLYSLEKENNNDDQWFHDWRKQNILLEKRFQFQFKHFV